MVFLGSEGGAHSKTSLTGVPVGPDMSGMEKMWNIFSAIGDIAFAYSFSLVLLEIQVNLLYIYIYSLYRYTQTYVFISYIEYLCKCRTH